MYEKGDRLCYEEFVSGQTYFIRNIIIPSLEILKQDKCSTFIAAAGNYEKNAEDILKDFGKEEYGMAASGLECTLNRRNSLFRII